MFITVLYDLTMGKSTNSQLTDTFWNMDWIHFEIHEGCQGGKKYCERRFQL